MLHGGHCQARIKADPASPHTVLPHNKLPDHAQKAFEDGVARGKPNCVIRTVAFLMMCAESCHFATKGVNAIKDHWTTGTLHQEFTERMQNDRIRPFSLRLFDCNCKTFLCEQQTDESCDGNCDAAAQRVVSMNTGQICKVSNICVLFPMHAAMHAANCSRLPLCARCKEFNTKAKKNMAAGDMDCCLPQRCGIIMSKERKNHKRSA